VFRIDASGPVSIQNGFIDIAKQLGKNLDKIQLTDALSKRPWLLVLDDEDMAYQEEIDRYITLHANATVLISTRRRVGGGKSRIELKEMQLNEATNLLLRRVGFWTPKFDDGDFRNSVRALVQDDLGSNPLAILQAGAVIDASYPISIHSFRKRFASLADGPQTLLQRPHGESDYPYPSVWKTFQMCFERIKAAAERDDDQEAVLARNALELIRFFAFLSADVPEEFLLNALRKVFSSKTVGKQTYPLELLHQAKSSEPIIFSLDVIKPACKILDQFSLIEPLQKTVLRHGDYVSDHHTYRLHTLVKTCVHLDLRTEKTAEISSNSWLKAMHTLSCALAFNPDVLDENLQRLSLPHIKACTGTKCLAARVAEYGEQANLDFIWLHFARLYLRGRKPNEALRLQREVLEYRESQGNPKLLVLDAKHEIASSKRGLGDLEGALKDRQEVLRDLQKLGSPTQDLRLFAMENLADSYNDFGRFEEALSLQLSVVQAFESSGRFVELWSARAKLAGILSQIGQDHESLKIREEIFKYRKIHGNPLDYNLLLAMTHLSHSLLKSGYLVRARKLREEVLHRMCTIYEDKDTHPDILDAKSDLATILDAFEEWDHAMRLKEEVIRCREHVFGRHHPETWKAMNSIALHYKRRNMLEDSLSWHQQVLSLYKSSENPRLVLQAEDEITRIEHTMLFNDYQDKTVGREGLEKRAKALVSKRLSLLNTWQHYFDDDLSNIWQATHFLIDAYFDFPAFFDRWKAHEKRQSILREQLVKCKENAPEVLYTQLRLANGWSRLYESDRAIRICQEVVEARVNTLGEQHPDTVDSREYLAYLFFRSSSSRDNHESALSIYRTLLVLHEQTKGPSHPKVAFVTEQIRKLEHLFDDDEGQSTGESVTTAQSLSRPPTAKSDSIKGNEVVTKSYGSGKLPTRSPTNEREQPKRLLSHTDVRDFVADS
jgi:tetratricopeptide (TPR) repeat protein